jgi:hypothetical protein
MQKKAIPAICICMAIAFLLVQPVAAEWLEVGSDTIERDILALNYEYHKWTDLTTSDKLRYQWTTGVIACHFYIMNEDNYNRWASLQTAQMEVTRESLTSDTYEWTVPRDGETWYIVWYNPALLSTHLSATWWHYRFSIPFIPGFPWQAIAVGAILAIGLAMLRRARTVGRKPT